MGEKKKKDIDLEEISSLEKDKKSPKDEFDFDDDEIELEEKKSTSKTESKKSSKEDLKKSESKKEAGKKDSKSSSKDKNFKTESKKEKKEEKEELLDDEEESFGAKIVLALVILAIIIVLVLKNCSGGKIEYKVTFDTNGGSNITELTIQENGTVIKPVDPTKEGYIFAGWYYNDELFDFDTQVTEDIKLEAKWEEDAQAAVTGVSLDQTDLTLSPNGTATLVATVEPTDAKDKSLTWESSNTAVATVDENGNVKAIKNGTATITVTTTDGEYKATATITVTQDVVAVTGVELSSTTLSLGTGESSSLKATVKPSDASNKGITWSSSNTSVATVDANGKVTAKKEGTAVITATTKEGNYTATATVTVKDVAVTGISVDKTAVTLVVGNTATVKTTFKPTNATNKNVTWTSSDSSVATVSNGTITAKKKGTATITVTTKDGNKTATVTVTVNEPVKVTGITVKLASTLEEGKTTTATATVTPSDAANKAVTWTSSDSSVASVDANGKVTAKKAGTATITATAKDGSGVAGTATITVTEKPASYVLTLTANYMEGTGAVTQYNVTVTKNGSAFTDFSIGNYNGTAFRANGTIAANKIDSSIKTATLTFADKSTVTATVNYK